ncbi:MAG: hypothetical protein GY826_19795 [Fuerstiella sp.]|nr:hypothetical protein [Fuerstiella sp.]
MAMARNAVITVARYQVINRAVPQYFLTALRADDGKQLFQVELPDEPLPGGLIIDRDGKLMVAMLDGGVACFGK